MNRIAFFETEPWERAALQRIVETTVGNLLSFFRRAPTNLV